MVDNRKANDKRYKDKKKKLGICIDCTKPAAYNQTRCKEHIERTREYNKSIYKKKISHRRKNDLCLKCGKPLNIDCDEGYVTCVNCRQSLTTQNWRFIR